MLKAFIEKIESMAAPKTYDVQGATFCNKELREIIPHKDHAKQIKMSSLDSLCTMVRKEADDLFMSDQIVVRVVDPTTVCVYTTLDSELDREYLYECQADTPSFRTGTYYTHEEIIIKLRSIMIPNDDSAYLLRLLGCMSKESKVSSMDNGVTQAVQAVSGIALAQNVEVKPIVTLRPFRTFLEVAQPESDFLLRVSDNGQIALYEADGGVWKLEAVRSIAFYIKDKLFDLVEKGRVIVLR